MLKRAPGLAGLHRDWSVAADEVRVDKSRFERPVRQAPLIQKSLIKSSAATGSKGVTCSSGDLGRSTDVPLYQKVAQRLQGAIESGALAPDGRLDNEIDLAARYGVSRATMRRAIGELVANGTLIRQRGVGTQVVQGMTVSPMQLISMFDDPTGPGRQFTTIVLVNEVIPGPVSVTRQLEVPARQLVLHLRRVRFIDGEPAAILENYLPIDLLDLHETDFTSIRLYRAMRATGTHPKVSKQWIGARIATAQECALLHEPPRAPIMTLDRVTHADTGRPVDWGRHVLRPAKFSYTMTLVVPEAR